MAWRITFTETEETREKFTSRDTRCVQAGVVVGAHEPVELRDNTGQIVRLGKGATFTLEETPLGLMPIYGDGPVYVAKKGGCGKYRTSCWLAAASPPSDRPDIFMRPGKAAGTDEFFAVTGDINIYEFDERGRTFIICSLSEGQKAVISYVEGKPSVRQRYKATVSDISESEWEVIVSAYMDPRKWR
jgi:hypothetical protein